ncbi:MAG TPA: biopolymer transporter ExbD [Thermodesulfatator sp.]|nr:biopolymer transporter ExbD [Thermodesulfatator sp.]
MAINGSKKGRYLADINVTPLVDVVLVLLIIFMITAPMMTRGVSVNLPQTKAGELPRLKEPLVVTITQTGDIYIGREKVGLKGLKARFYQAARSKSEVFIEADRQAHYGLVARVLALARALGIEEVGLVTAPPPAKR